ncbi:MAG: TolB family protein [Gaiellaceae bacterium]
MRSAIIIVLVVVTVGAFAPKASTSAPGSLLPSLRGWQIAYTAAYKKGAFHLYAASADGSHARQIDRLGGDKHQPNWSPDGSRIAFRWVPHDENHTSLAIIKADGSQFVNLSKKTGLYGWSPSWSPNGLRLVSAATRRAGTPNSLYVMGVGGTRPIRITPSGREAQYASWSPNGRWIAFTYVIDGGFDLFLIHPDGSDLRRLTHEGASGQNNWSMWSPDSRRLAWGRGDAIWVMDADGSHKHLVTRAGGVPGAWAPGPFITFGCRGRAGKVGLCVIRSDGTGLTHLLNGREANFPGWRPRQHR